MYDTEPETGVAIKESIAEGVVKRKDLFVTTKISSNFTEAQTAIDVSLKKLDLTYVDLYVACPFDTSPFFHGLLSTTSNILSDKIFNSLSVLDGLRYRSSPRMERHGGS